MILSGNEAGDRVLQFVFSTLKNSRGSSLLTVLSLRFSEEEFYSYLSCNRIADSASIAGRKNHSHHLNGGAEIAVTVSIGYTSKPDEYQNMIRMADKAMYRAKADGKNRAACLD